MLLIKKCQAKKKLVSPILINVRVLMYTYAGFMCGVEHFGCKMNVRNNSG